jgi:hypothetical protein
VRRRDVLGVLVGGFAAALVSGCNPFGPSSYRYKMTIEVDTPQGMKAFSSVREVSYSSRMEGGYNTHVEGEAVILALPGGPVFALLRGADGSSEYAGEIAEAGLVSEIIPGGANHDYRAGEFAEIYPTKPNIRYYMPKDPLPMFVRFRDLGDPKSVERINPVGIGITRVTIEKTFERVSTEIEEPLRANGIMPDRGLDNTVQVSANLTLAQKLGYNDFKRGQ